ncbi:MAG: antibiotic transport system ATP-binding protein [Bacteroidetes bacterium]|nr:MAG: antibiotic transport system ATP-binding protein [Bacteroidota bacterium]
MSIKVEYITKMYGEQYALDNISFEVNTGEIVGFLGPNGAGKSTMMKILTCYLPPSAGTATVNGYNVMENPIEVKKSVGYLPEHNPLYLDMYVKEYLEFIARIHKVNSVKKRVAEMVETTGLQVEQHKKIGALSKGYRQRVGLAQALIHDPEVLILDEPTTGLDPNQLEEIRRLIKNIGRQKTVMLSTHIMQEVELLCSRVIIIDKGKIVTDKETGALQQADENRIIIVVEFDKTTSIDALKQIGGVLEAVETKTNTYQIVSETSPDIRPALFRFAVDNKLSILEMQREELKLEDVFKKLTKK